ncbi:hypothetical protein MKW92_010271 [Papaver armeniacum]|nr:hypothetical protein MKW92_010271 [Papaver armeniacum]
MRTLIGDGFVCVMGNSQYCIYKQLISQFSHIGMDIWDMSTERRNKKLLEKLYAEQKEVRFIFFLIH